MEQESTGLTTGSMSSANELLPSWFVNSRRAAFSIFANVAVCILAAICTNKASKGEDNTVAYLLALFCAMIALPIEWAVDRRSPELTKDLRFDLAGAMVALAIIRLEATRSTQHIYFSGTSAAQVTQMQIAIDMFFFIIFLGAKLVGRNGSREVALLVMADIVDFIELTYSMQGAQGQWKSPSQTTRNAIVAFTFIFALVTLLLQRAEGPGQKALNALVQGLFVHFPIVCIRLAIPINEGGMPSFNAVFIVKNIVELISCAMDFLEAGSEVKRQQMSGEPGYSKV